MRDKILQMLFKNGRLDHYCLKKEWYINNAASDIYDQIISRTSFLNKNSSLRERIFYIECEYNQLQLCPYCHVRPLIFNKNKVSLSTHCGDSNCKSRHTSFLMKRRISSLTPEQKRQSCQLMTQKGLERIHSIAGKTFEEIYGKQRADEIKNKIANSPIHRSEEVKRKRIQSRKENNENWHTPETKEKIRQSNKSTHTSPAFREKYKQIYELSRIKQSATMKQKILDGTFTPHPTNSWTRWKAYIKDKSGNIKKFRSNWEAAFWLLNPHCEYEKIRIPYVFNGIFKIYIVDFVDFNSKTIYEIKPNSVKHNEKNIIKREYALKWSNENNFKYIDINDEWFKNNITNIDFSIHYNLKKSFLPLLSK